MLNPNGHLVVPAHMSPGFRSSVAIERGVERNLIVKTWGGLGDQVCAEPTLRFALKTFKDCDISLASEAPELFAHLKFKDVYDLRRVTPKWENYLAFDTILPPSHLQWEFMSHMLINCVDYPSLCAFRCQLPIVEREITMPTETPIDIPLYGIVVHPGRHWQSKTFPKWWWDEVLAELRLHTMPIIIGANTDDNRGTVDVDVSGCIDLRNELSVMDSIALLQRSKVLLTNDSAPLHMAASGDAWIGFIATCKHPDYITHWRHGQWGWRMQNHSRGGIWDHIDYCPNKKNALEAENVGDLLLDWLPAPRAFARWGIEKWTANF